jgi:hypothetical protein
MAAFLQALELEHTNSHAHSTQQPSITPENPDVQTLVSIGETGQTATGPWRPNSNLASPSWVNTSYQTKQTLPDEPQWSLLSWSASNPDALQEVDPAAKQYSAKSVTWKPFPIRARIAIVHIGKFQVYIDHVVADSLHLTRSKGSLDPSEKESEPVRSFVSLADGEMHWTTVFNSFWGSLPENIIAEIRTAIQETIDKAQGRAEKGGG